MNEHRRVEEQEIGELIASAGPRPAVPAGELAAIHAAARSEWRVMVERERRRRRRWRWRAAMAAGVVLAVTAAWWWSGDPAPTALPAVARVELVNGAARAGSGELVVGEELQPGTRIETRDGATDAASGAALRLAGGQSLRLASATAVRLISERRLELLRGTLYVDSPRRAGSAGVEVATALGEVREIGTQFEVRLDEAGNRLRLRVREGECILDSASESRRAGRGEELSLLADGSVARASVATYGAGWQWVVATAPSIEIEGLLLAEFLEWATRELGRELRFSDPELEAAAREEIKVHGSIAGLTPEQALTLVLQGTALSHRAENGTLLVSR